MKRVVVRIENPVVPSFRKLMAVNIYCIEHTLKTDSMKCWEFDMILNDDIFQTVDSRISLSSITANYDTTYYWFT
jgi:hypothetical protein